MIALDVTTGRPATGFGREGLLDLSQGVLDPGLRGRVSLRSPPSVYGNIVNTGSVNGEGAPSQGAYGDVRGWDAYTGLLLWTFHTVPRPGEPGNDTWPEGAWKSRSGTNAWGFLTLDLKRGIVYVPLGAPTSDFYCAGRQDGASALHVNVDPCMRVDPLHLCHRPLQPYRLLRVKFRCKSVMRRCRPRGNSHIKTNRGHQSLPNHWIPFSAFSCARAPVRIFTMP
jgi:hypothetical protein